MSTDADVEAVLPEALTLPQHDRAEVAAELVASLDDPPVDDAAVVQAKWAEELERRARRAISGEDPGEPWPKLQARLRSKLAQ